MDFRNIAAVLVQLVIFVSVAEAATFTVDRADFDEGDATPDGICAMSGGGGCTLRAAMMEANRTPEADIINLPASTTASPIFVRRFRLPDVPGYPYQELNEPEGDIDITSSVTIRGSNPSDPAATIVSGRGRGEGFDPAAFDRIFQISPIFGPNTAAPIEVVIEGVTFANGRSEVENWGGGAILVYSQASFGPSSVPPKLTLRNVVFRDNYSAVSGGALSNYGGTVDIDNVIFEGNANSYTPNYTGSQNFPEPVSFLSGGQGGALANWAGTLTMRNSVITGSYSQAGGAIYAQDASNIPTLTVIENSVIRGNFGFMGAAIFNMSRGTWDFGSATLIQHGIVLNRVTFETNEAEFAGGAVYNLGTMLLSNCVLSTNRAWDAPGNPSYPNKGGGIYNSGRVLDIQSTTIAGNDAEEPRTIAATSDESSGGDEIYLDHTNNVGQRGFRFSLVNSIIGDNLIGLPVNDPGAGITDDCVGPIGYSDYIVSRGGNIFRDTTCATTLTPAGPLATADKFGQDPLIETLADNGATPIVGGNVVRTMALKAGSPALGNALETFCPGSDARNFERLGACDSGAFQQNVNTASTGNRAPTAQVDSVSTNVGSPVTIAVLSNDSDPDPVDATKQLSLVAGTLTAPGNGVVNESGSNTVLYTPNAGFAGADQFEYQVSDGSTLSKGNVTVTVYDAAVNTPPAGTADTAIINMIDPAVTGSSSPQQPLVIDVLANDRDQDTGDTFKILNVNGPNPPVSGVTFIEPQRQGPGPAPSYTVVTARVDGGVSGTVNFSYNVIDNRGATTSNIPVALTINTIPAVMLTDIPKVVDVQVGQAVSGTIKASDRDGQPLRFSLMQPPADQIGSASVNETTGNYTFTANSVVGDGRFLVGVTDGIVTIGVPVGANVVNGVQPAPVTGGTDGVTNPGTSPGNGTSEPVPSPSGDSGGGSINVFTLLMLPVLGWYRRRQIGLLNLR